MLVSAQGRQPGRGGDAGRICEGDLKLLELSSRGFSAHLVDEDRYQPLSQSVAVRADLARRVSELAATQARGAARSGDGDPRGGAAPAFAIRSRDAGGGHPLPRG